MHPPLALLALVSPLTLAVAALHNPILASRQSHGWRRAVPGPFTTDICAALDIDLKLLASLRANDPLVPATLQVCLCLSLVPAFVHTDLVARAAVRILGEPTVTAFIQGLVTSAPGRQTCTYPAHAHPLCTTANPCAFECADGYSPHSSSNSSSTCVCPPPNTDCNGICGHFPHGCGSAAPSRQQQQQQQQRRGVEARCGPEREVCGVLGGRAGAWECVDTRSNLESCGGCTAVSPLGMGMGAGAGAGVDCSAIAEVADVACVRGECVVQRCKHGYEPAPSGGACVVAAVEL